MQKNRVTARDLLDPDFIHKIEDESKGFKRTGLFSPHRRDDNSHELNNMGHKEMSEDFSDALQ